MKRGSTKKFMQTMAVMALALMGMATALADSKPLLQEGKKTLYQRVLTTPTCQLMADPGASSGSDQPPFTRFYVYKREDRDGASWLQVGPDSQGTTVGWIAENCAVEWKMQLTLAFTNPAGRDRQLFLKSRQTWDDAFAQENPERVLGPIRQSMANNGHHEHVLAMEPELAIDLNEQFYLLPILDAEEVFTEQGFRVRVLNVASVTASEAGSGSGAGAGAVVSMLKGFSAAVVFVIDSTISMGPYIDRTREAVQTIYANVEKENLQGQVKFGLVAYRSSLGGGRQMDYVNRMFVDPSTVRDGADFLRRVQSLEPATGSTPKFDEDAYAGLKQALDDVKWNEFGGRYLILITDAGALEGHDELSSTRWGAEQIRQEAQLRGVALYALHLKTDAGKSNHESAQAQYVEASHNAYLNKPLYYPVDAGDVDSFGRIVDELAAAITGQVKAAYRGEMAAGSALGADSRYQQSSDTEPGNVVATDVEKLGHAMRLAYLGQVSGTSAPPVFQAWITDRDPGRQDVPTTEVRVLLTRGELSNLAEVVKHIADAANEGLISPTQMFERLRSVAAAMGNDPARLRQSGATLSEMGLLSEYLEGLPYLSEVLGLDEDAWKSMQVADQERLIRRLNTKLNYYRHYNQDTERWISLAEGSDARDFVYPVPLEALP